MNLHCFFLDMNALLLFWISNTTLFAENSLTNKEFTLGITVCLLCHNTT
jgi:hypothetical protein